MKFTEFNLHEDVQKGIDAAGFTDCTPVQEQTITKVLEGFDILAQSQTGTGKTAAFLVSLFQMFTENRINNKKALIMVPTRELAVQIEEEARKLGQFLPYRFGSFFGGVGYQKQDMLIADGVDFYIATPGRLIDYVKGGKISLSDIGAVVIDEADRMFDMGFIPDIKYLFRKLPAADQRVTMLFSATLSNRVRGLAWDYMKNPTEIEIAPESITVDLIEQSLYHVGTQDKMRLLLGLLKKLEPRNTIIFANTKHMVEEISLRLRHNGFENEFIIGDLPQKKRQKIIDGIKAGNISMLVATDVAARGLHVDDLDLVFNYDLPDDCENYIHRIGRTARAGKEGRAVALACEKYVYNLEAIEKYIGRQIPVASYGDELLAEDMSANVRLVREHTRQTHRSQKQGRVQEKRPASNRISKSVNTSHQSYDKPRPPRKHTVVAKPVEEQPKAIQHADAIIEKRRKAAKPKRNGTLEQRLEYYRQKYGESFKVTDDFIRAEQNRMKREKKGLLRRVLGIFGL